MFQSNENYYHFIDLNIDFCCPIFKKRGKNCRNEVGKGKYLVLRKVTLRVILDLQFSEAAIPRRGFVVHVKNTFFECSLYL